MEADDYFSKTMYFKTQNLNNLKEFLKFINEVVLISKGYEEIYSKFSRISLEDYMNSFDDLLIKLLEIFNEIFNDLLVTEDIQYKDVFNLLKDPIFKEIVTIFHENRSIYDYIVPIRNLLKKSRNELYKKIAISNNDGGILYVRIKNLKSG